jgi:hypothetical protein
MALVWTKNQVVLLDTSMFTQGSSPPVWILVEGGLEGLCQLQSDMACSHSLGLHPSSFLTWEAIPFPIILPFTDRQLFLAAVVLAAPLGSSALVSGSCSRLLFLLSSGGSYWGGLEMSGCLEEQPKTAPALSSFFFSHPSAFTPLPGLCG